MKSISHSTSLKFAALSAFVQARENSATAEVVKFLTDNTLSKPSVIEALGSTSQGNAIVGKALFTGMCLSCHVVGDEGAGVGPALDGSAQRDITHLLISIIDPDAASESAYILLLTNESSGVITEGLKTRQDRRGTSISHQGGHGQLHSPPHDQRATSRRLKLVYDHGKFLQHS